MKKVYLDTNTYLGYFGYESDLKPLHKLLKLVDSSKVQLVLTSQTKREYLKNQKLRIDNVKTMLSKESKISYPKEIEILKGAEKDEIKKQIDLANKNLPKERQDRLKKYQKHVADTKAVINELFKKAILFNDSDEVVLKAIARYARGYPPQKGDGKYGDAINWETLKENIRGEDLIVISKDGDYQSKDNKKFLESEWKKHSGKKLDLQIALSKFVDSVEPTDKISEATIKNETSLFQTAAVLLRDNQVLINGVPQTTVATTQNSIFRSSLEPVTWITTGTTQPFATNVWRGSVTKGLDGFSQDIYCPYCRAEIQRETVVFMNSHTCSNCQKTFQLFSNNF